jgi:hypothetical protein
MIMPGSRSLDVAISNTIECEGDESYDDIKIVANNMSLLAALGEDLELGEDSKLLFTYDSIRNMTVLTGDAGTQTTYDVETNTLTVPRGLPGLNGVDGQTPVYEFTVEGSELVINLTGYIPSEEIPEGEW